MLTSRKVMKFCVILLFIIIDLLTSVSNLVVNKEDAAHALTNAAPSESQQNGK